MQPMSPRTPAACPGCAHPPSPPRPPAPIRALLHLRPGRAGCSVRERFADGRTIWQCTCRDPFHTPDPGGTA